MSLKEISDSSVGSVLLGRHSWIMPLTVSLVISVVGWWSFGTIKQATMQKTADELTTILNADVTALTIWIESQRSTVEMYAEQPEVVFLVNELASVARESQNNFDAIRASEPFISLREFFGPVCEAFGYVSFVVTDIYGNNIAAMTDQILGTTVPENLSTEFTKTLRGETVFGKPFLSQNLRNIDGTPQAVMFVSAPVRDALGNVIALLSMLIRPEEDFTKILSVARIGESGETYAFDKNGLMISRSRFDSQLKEIGLIADTSDAKSVLNVQLRDPGVDLTQGEQAARDRNSLPLTRMVASAVAGEQGVDVDGYRDYRGVPVVGAWIWLSEYDFGVATEVDAAEAYSVLDILMLAFWALLGTLALSVLIIVLSTLKIARLGKRARRAESKMRTLGQYTLEDKIGAGGMGEVYRATHALLRRPTALKLLNASNASETAMRRFEQEVQLTAKLTHPNTITIYDYGHTPDGVFYYVMEYLDGVALDTLVASFGPQPIPRVIHILLQVCASLREAHASGLIHRDIKPGNIMLSNAVSNYDFVKVLDFGIAKDLAASADMQLTSVGQVTGTPQYIAPETIRNSKKIDARSDIYCIGATAYYLVTGTHLFNGETSAEIFAHHLDSPPERPSVRRREEIASDFEQVLLRCLEKKPEDRPQSVEELTSLLRSCADSAGWREPDACSWWSMYYEQLGIKPPQEPCKQIELAVDLQQRAAL